MRQLLLLILAALLPQIAMARVYVCIEPRTGHSTFTDVACDDNGAADEEVRVAPANSGSGRNMASPPVEKTWNSERDNRETGRELSTRRHSQYHVGDIPSSAAADES